jgi:signal transduction histidine kinase
VDRSRLTAWLVVAWTAAILFWLGLIADSFPPLGDIAFWAGLLAAAELLPVSLGFHTEVTMAFPIHLAIAIVFRQHPFVAMAIAGLAAMDVREFKREILPHRALFNRALMSLSMGALLIPLTMFGRDPLENAAGIAIIVVGATFNLATNLGLLILVLNASARIGVRTAIDNLVPKPVFGFILSNALLAVFGVGAAVADDVGKWAVAAILIPLLFARLSILGARTQQELAERIQEQQKQLLDATERVFKEREEERHRIAADIHDTSLQTLAAAAYASDNALEFLRAGKLDKATDAIAHTHGAIDDAISDLRTSLVDLRRSAVEEGGLIETIQRFADQLSTLWGARVEIVGGLSSEPPLPVAMAALQIVQEGVTNAVKHSSSEKVSVTISDENGMVRITVEDQGSGFDPNADPTEDHVGVRMMRERASKVGGRIQFDSRPGMGTRVVAVLPGGVSQ